MPPAGRVRPYKDFLTPALHRRFSRAAVTLLGICYVEAILIGEFDSLIWSWFPFGRVGIRTGLLFICAFSIFVLRVAQLHVGIRTTKSGFETFREYAFRFQTIETTGWYVFSAWLFTEIYLFSAPTSANIGWLTSGNKHVRQTLNERPIYLMSSFICLGIVQAIVHLWYDYDRIDMPVPKTTPGSSSGPKVPPGGTASSQLSKRFPQLIYGSSIRAAVMLPAMLLIYSIFIRQRAWKYTLWFAKYVWTLPKSNALPTTPPFHIYILVRQFTAGFLLVMMWEVGNAAFSAYVAQEPLKNERPITYESRDPNGSLLTGLRGKKLQTRAFAFWELVYIAERFQGRRKALFEEIDRTGGSTWSQILSICLQTLKDIDTRYIAHFHPAPEPPKTHILQEKKVEGGLPRIVAPAKDENIFSAPIQPKTTGAFIAQKVTDTAKIRGQSPPGSLLITQGEKLLEQAKAALQKSNPNSPTPGSIWASLEGYTRSFLQTTLGRPFRQEFRRRIAAIVLGTPYGDVGVIVDAIDALTRLAVCSLKEDMYGNVQKDVSTIIITFTATAKRLKETKAKLGLHWTDIGGKEESPEVDIILAALQRGLHDLLEAFSEYADDLGLTQKDLREAREIAVTIVPVNTTDNQTSAIGGAVEEPERRGNSKPTQVKNGKRSEAIEGSNRIRPTQSEPERDDVFSSRNRPVEMQQVNRRSEVPETPRRDKSKGKEVLRE